MASLYRKPQLNKVYQISAHHVMVSLSNKVLVLLQANAMKYRGSNIIVKSFELPLMACAVNLGKHFRALKAEAPLEPIQKSLGVVRRETPGGIGRLVMLLSTWSCCLRHLNL
jgi:hypothetical protein